jgi:hypothetical protein
VGRRQETLSLGTSLGELGIDASIARTRCDEVVDHRGDGVHPAESIEKGRLHDLTSWDAVSGPGFFRANLLIGSIAA